MGGEQTRGAAGAADASEPVGEPGPEIDAEAQAPGAESLAALPPTRLVELLAAALRATGTDVIALDETGGVAYSTLDAGDQAAAELAAYAAAHRERAREQGRLLLNRNGCLYTLFPQHMEVAGQALDVFSIRAKRSHVVRAGIEWLGAEEAQAEFDQSAYGIINGAESLSPLVLQAYERHVPVMMEGEAGCGKDQTAILLYLRGSARNQPFVRISCDLINEKNWRWLLHGADSPLFQTDMTVYLRSLHALDEKQSRELLSCARDTALAERCRVVLSGNDVPGGGECDAVAAFADELRCAVTIASPVRDQPSKAACVERYLAHVAQMFEMQAPALDSAAAAELDAYRWPRNFSQVREVAERLFIVNGEGKIGVDVVREVLAQEDVIRSGVFSSPALETDLFILRPLADTERDIAQLVLDHLDGNKTRTAEVLGISRTTLWRLLRE